MCIYVDHMMCTIYCRINVPAWINAVYFILPNRRGCFNKDTPVSVAISAHRNEQWNKKMDVFLIWDVKPAYKNILSHQKECLCVVTHIHIHTFACTYTFVYLYLSCAHVVVCMFTYMYMLAYRLLTCFIDARHAWLRFISAFMYSAPGVLPRTEGSAI